MSRNSLLAISMLGLSACASQPVDWTTRYAPDALYQNRSNVAVPVYSAPDKTSAPVGSVWPNEGGFIQTCNATADWCKIPFGNAGQAGWVDMVAFFKGAV